ncbi:DUF3501 family protein [Nitrospira moscoviensis]|uniref:DUF3501 family protein n=1 Tax=Nitrospira moscoviensis TaxID=42253 RepID=A0A0K2GFQ6_NITMO|nr:DUF3501 family protein [Nitrospira moscoviensis]ALA59417.1 hypothetical protein NITMOv2_3016 [Nitrospira moscoviensis]
MEPLTVEDLKPLDEYEQTREEVRRWTIALKRSRRISIGEYITVVFENRDTLWFQIQEMIRAEKIVDREKVRAEVETYNQLIPGPGELSATLMIEITDKSRVKDILDRLRGLDREKTVWLRIGPHMVYGVFEEGHSKEDKISAVHFVRFHVPESIKTELRNLQTRIEIGITHPTYHAVVPVPDDLRFALLTDLD